ncbi:MAG: hypothetical protein AMXMBFR36_36150 [Acidobacteriota bacterium]
MSKRLQVLLEEEELREVKRAARLARVSVADWVRDALRAKRQAAPASAPDRKLAVVRAATRHAFPVGEVGAMLAEIESGYGVEGES